MTWDVIKPWTLVLAWTFLVLDAIFVLMLALQRNVGDDAAGRGMATGFAMLLAPFVFGAAALMTWGMYARNPFAFAIGGTVACIPLFAAFYHYGKEFLITILAIVLRPNIWDGTTTRGTVFAFVYVMVPLFLIAAALVAWGVYARTPYPAIAGALIAALPLTVGFRHLGKAAQKVAEREIYWQRVYKYKSPVVREISQAIRDNNVETVRRLLDTNPGLREKDHYGNTLAWEAWLAAYHHVSMEPLRLLFEKGIHPDECPTPKGDTLLAETANSIEYENSNSIELVKLLVEHGADVNRPTTTHGQPILFYAYYHPALLDFLKQHGANIDWADSDGRSALLDWAWQERWAGLKWLIENGANLDGRFHDRTLDLCMKEAVDRVEGDESRLPKAFFEVRDAIAKRRRK